MTTKDAELAELGTEIHRLNSVVVTKDASLAELGTEVHRLNGVVVTKDAGLAELATEVHRLNGVVVAKDAALAGLEAEIQRLNSSVITKDTGLVELGAEIQRLGGCVIAKDADLAELGAEVQRLNSVVVAKDAGLAELGADIHRLNSVVVAKDARLAELDAEIHRLTGVVAATTAENARLGDQSARYQGQVAELTAEVDRFASVVEANTVERSCRESALRQAEERTQDLRNDLDVLRQTDWFKLRAVLLARPVNWRSIRVMLRLCTDLCAAAIVRKAPHADVSCRPQDREVGTPADSPNSSDGIVYAVRAAIPATESRPRVVHVIANFCTGGSSRLVVDLIEGLGQHYEQSVVTSFIPAPPAYTNLDITEFRFPEDSSPFLSLFSDIQPKFVHVHYWGECDEPWYAKAIHAAEALAIPIIENVNTPVKPFLSPAVRRYVYVSDYVRSEFGHGNGDEITIYPGSDFSHFTRNPDDVVAEDCVGMVYRLERDKLNEDSILPFIHVAKRRPATRVLIVGGGSLLEPYKQSVAAAGVSANFEFTGYVAYKDLPDLYRRMSVFVAPVWKESFGQVSSFAMNMLIPVCGYDVGAIGEIVVSPGLLAPAADAQRLAEIVIRLLDSPEERSSISAHLQRRVQEAFSVEAMIHAYARLYQEFAEPAPQR